MATQHKHPLERHSKQPKVRSSTIRKSARDGGSLTPTEKRKKAKLMRQFLPLESGTYGNSEAFKAGWQSAFGLRRERKEKGLCPGCGRKPAVCREYPYTDLHDGGWRLCPDMEEKPYRLTHHGRVEPRVLLSESEAGDPWAP